MILQPQTNGRLLVALFTTDLSLSVTEIIEYNGARWMEAGFKELKQVIGSSET